MCECYERIIKSKWFNENTPDKFQGIGSVFDDFSIVDYTTEDGQQKTCFRHRHSGIIDSYAHYISVEEVPKNANVVIHPHDNKTVIPQIKKYLETTGLGNKKIHENTLCKYAVTKEGCWHNDCKYNHNKKEFLCPWRISGCKNKKCEFSHELSGEDRFDMEMRSYF